MLALKGLAPSIGLIIPGAVTGVADQIGKPFFSRCDLLEQALLLLA